MLFKEFITKHRRIELDEPYIFVNVHIASAQYKYIQDLENNKFVDGEYHKYCGEIKIIINNFINYWSETIHKCDKESDTLLRNINKMKLLALIKDTAKKQTSKQEKYLCEFGPAKNAEEQKILDEISELFNMRLQDLQEMEKTVNNFTVEKQFTEFLKHQLDLSISKTNDTFEMFHAFVAENLATHSHKIRISHEEILLRMNNNLKSCKERRMKELIYLRDELYDLNKDRMMVARQHHHRIMKTAEVDYTLAEIRKKIERHQEDRPFAPLEEEVEYWTKRTRQYQRLDERIRKIKTELQNITEKLEKFNNMRTTEYAGSKKTCWITIGENYKRRKEFCEKMLLDASKAILTFFAVKGQDRILYEDKIGKYAIDDYGHQVYYFNHGETLSHITCEGKLVQIPHSVKYYSDEVGRYILSDAGEKLYQVAPCTSTYKLNEEDGLLVKTTKDCGHSETTNPNCALKQIKNLNDFELLPAAEPVNIKKTLDPAVVKYLWDSVGYILPDALYDTGMKQPRNPIHYLANRLIYHKYHKNNQSQLKMKMKETEKYRVDMIQKRKDKEIGVAKALRAKEVQPRKPEESDDTEDIQVLAARAALKNLIEQLMTNS